MRAFVCLTKKSTINKVVHSFVKWLNDLINGTFLSFIIFWYPYLPLESRDVFGQLEDRGVATVLYTHYEIT